MTSPSEAFLLDANVFIEPMFIDPKNRWYPFDVVPGYWDFLQRELGGAHVRSVVHVSRSSKDTLMTFQTGLRGLGERPSRTAQMIPRFSRAIWRFPHMSGRLRGAARDRSSAVPLTSFSVKAWQILGLLRERECMGRRWSLKRFRAR